jgi:hypothetical protein
MVTAWRRCVCDGTCLLLGYWWLCASVWLCGCRPPSTMQSSASRWGSPPQRCTWWLRKPGWRWGSLSRPSLHLAYVHGNTPSIPRSAHTRTHPAPVRTVRSHPTGSRSALPCLVPTAAHTPAGPRTRVVVHWLWLPAASPAAPPRGPLSAVQPGPMLPSDWQLRKSCRGLDGRHAPAAP